MAENEAFPFRTYPDRAIRAEVVFPLLGSVSARSIAEHITIAGQVTFCANCHARETRVEDELLGDQAFESEVIEPNPEHEVERRCSPGVCTGMPSDLAGGRLDRACRHCVCNPTSPPRRTSKGENTMGRAAKAVTPEGSGRSLILVLLESVQDAARVIDELLTTHERGELGLLMTDRAAERAFGRAEVRDAQGAQATFSGGVHGVASGLRPLAALSAPGSGLVAAGPIAPALTAAGLGSQNGLERALEGLGLQRTGEVARAVADGAVMVGIEVDEDDEVPGAVVRASETFWRIPRVWFESLPGVITPPTAPTGDQDARYRPVIETRDEARGSITGASKQGV